MAHFEHPLQLFALDYPDDWELRYQEETGGVLFIRADSGAGEDGCALNISPLAVVGEGFQPAGELLKIAERLNIPLPADQVREATEDDTVVAYAEAERAGVPSGPLPAGSRFRFWVIRRGTLALHVVQLGPGADQPAQREAANAVLRSLAFPEIYPPTPEEFRARVLEVLARERPQYRAVPHGQWEIELVPADDGPAGRLGLENIYRTCLLNAESAGALIRHYLDQVLDAGDSVTEYDRYEAVRDRLLPMLKSEEWVRDVPGGTDLFTVPFAEGLVTCFAVDEPTRVAYVTQEMVRKWDVPPERVQEVAQDNLAARATELEMTALSGADDRPYALVLNMQDGYDATRLLLPSIREAIAAELGDEFLVGMPNRDFLIAFSERDPEMTAAIVRQVKQDYHKMNHPLTPVIFRVRIDSIEPAGPSEPRA